MASTSRISSVFARFLALEGELRAVRGGAHPDFARCCAALAALTSREPAAALAARIGERAKELRGAPGIAGATRPVFAAALATFGRSADDYVEARAALLPAMEGRRRASLPAAALAYAVAGRTTVTDADRERIRAVAPLAAAPWWSSRSTWNGFYAAALALRSEDLTALGARLSLASQALLDAGAPEDVARYEARRLALADVQPRAAAGVWRRLDDARRERQFRVKTPAGLLVAYATRAAERASDAVPTLIEAARAVDDLRPRPHALIRPCLAVGLAGLALSPEETGPADAAAALEAALLVVQANEEMAAAIAVTAAAGAAASG